MRLGRSPHTILSLVFVTVAQVVPPIAFACSYACMPIPTRVFDAEAIVVGHGVSAEKEETRPGVITTTICFQVDEVLKGTRYKAEDTITRKSTPSFWSGFGGTHLPTPGYGAFVIFMNKGQDGTLWVNPCSIAIESPDPAYRADLPEIRRIMEVASSPERFLDSTDATDVAVIRAWISRNYFLRSDPRTEKDNSGVTLALDRETVLSFLEKHASGKTRTTPTQQPGPADSALELLGRFCEERHYGLFKSRADEGNTGAQWTVMRIEAKREIPGLIERLRDLRRARWATLEQVPVDERQTVLWPDNEYANTIAALVKALRTANDREKGRAFVKGLQDRCTGASDVGVQLGDEAALASMFRPTWAGPRRGMSPRIFDPEAVREARQNIYDDPKAVGLLAAKGDQQVADFMIRLIRQGHGAGAAWAAVVQDEALTPDLSAALEHAHSLLPVSFAHTLGRMRSWKSIDILRNMEGLRRQAAQTGFLRGVVDVPQYWAEPYEWNPSTARLRELADAEGWPEGIFEALVQLSQELKTGAFPGMERPYQFYDVSIPWIPPAGLPDMPDPLAKDETWQFLSDNEDRVEAALRTGDAADKCKVLHAAMVSKAWLDQDVLSTLLRDRSPHVGTLAFRFTNKLHVELTEEQVRLWALEGSPEATTNAFRYIIEKRDPSHAPIVEEVFRRGWHLFDAQLYRAIIATDSPGCTLDWSDGRLGLRSYLTDHHPLLRRWAAVTLATIGDDGGADQTGTIIELLKTKRGHSGDRNSVPTGTEVSRALYLISQEGS